MAIKRLYWQKIKTVRQFPDGRIILDVEFLDSEGNLYLWTARWENFEEGFLKGCNTESFNKPDSQWSKRFYKDVKEVCDRFSGRLVDAYKQSGYFTRVRNGKIVLENYVYPPFYDYFVYDNPELAERVEPEIEEAELPTLLDITDPEFLDKWLGKKVDCLIVDGVVIKMSECRR